MNMKERFMGWKNKEKEPVPKSWWYFCIIFGSFVTGMYFSDWYRGLT